MELFWYLIVAIFVIIFFVLDGYDFGVGIIHLFLAKEEKDREVIAKAAGLFWDSNEVWLVAAGGMLFMAFPTFYASVFSGFYLPIMMVLWLVIFRAVGLEFRSQFDFPMWKAIWDTVFGISSFLLALFFGMALGNIVRGVNLGGVEAGVSKYEAHYFFLPLWDSSFSPTAADPGVIDWFTLVIGIIAVIVLAIHGANWIILKTNATINEKLKTVIFRLDIALLVLTVFSLLIWHIINPSPFQNFLDKPLLFVFPLIYLIGVIGLLFVHNLKKEGHGFILSSMLVVGGISFSLASMFPVILPSTNEINPALTIYNMAAAKYSLSVGTNWALVGGILIVIYVLVQKRFRGGKIDDMDYGH